MRFGSVCSGIEAATVAWNRWTPLWYSEIEPFACALLAERHGTTPNLGDMTAADFIDRAKAHGGIDVLVGGTPCQSFSVAGLRGGLADARGNLALRFLQLADSLRPEWVVWENVPGVLSSGGGRDFGSILGGLVQLGYGFAHRVLDAQYFGLAQRRKRVFVVGCAGGWQRAAAVLFERASLCGHHPPSREAWQGTTGSLAAGAADGGGLGSVAGTLQANYADKWGLDNQHVDAGCPMFITHTLPAQSASEDGTGRWTPIVPVFVGQAIIGNQGGGGNRAGYEPHEPHTTITRAGINAVAFSPQSGGDCRGLELKDTVQLQRCQLPGVLSHGVRRITPTECERLQGFPDGYTAITYRRKPAADGPRYRALGNSMAVPVMRWIGEQIALVDSETRITP